MSIDLNLLKTLGSMKQGVFAYLTCERLFPNYVYFSTNYNFGKPDKLRNPIDFLLYSIMATNADQNKTNAFIKSVDENTPDTEDFTTIFVSSALDACATILESLSFLLDKDFCRIGNISISATDTIDMYIQEKENLDFNNDKNFQQKINDHLLMQKEIAIQSGIINFLKQRQSIELEDIQILLRLQDNNKTSNLSL